MWESHFLGIYTKFSEKTSLLAQTLRKNFWSLNEMCVQTVSMNPHAGGGYISR